MSTALDKFAARMAWIRGVARGAFGASLVFLVYLVFAIFLTGCAEFSAVRSGVATHGAQAADAALDVAKWEVCTAATIGALERELGGDQQKILGWMLFCGKKPALAPALGTPPAMSAPQIGRPLHDEGKRL